MSYSIGEFAMCGNLDSSAVNTVDFACSGKCEVEHMECNQMTTPHVKAETLAVTSDGHPDAVLGNDQGTLTVSGDIESNNEVIGNTGLAQRNNGF